MATYLITFEITQQGIVHAKDIPGRVAASKQIVKSMGGEVKSFYALLGAAFDTLLILEAPDDETVGKITLAISALGNVRTSTHRAFSEEEYNNLIDALP